MRIHDIMTLIKKHNVENVVILCHHNADPDAVCAAFAFSRLLERLHSGLSIEIATANGPSKLSRSLFTTLPIKLTLQPHIEEAGLVVLVDTNTLQQLNAWSERIRDSTSPLIVIDHHAYHEETARYATFYISQEDASSTCEIIYHLFLEGGVELTKTEAMALFLGIAFDTKHFILAKSNTFKIVAELIDIGVDVEEALHVLSFTMDFSERVARLKAAQRVEIITIGNWIIVLSQITAFQASAARAFIRLGAHVAIVAGKKGNALQISLRSSRDFYKTTKIHLGRDIANPLGTRILGMGGGHATSAGANGAGTVNESLKICLKLFKEKLR